MCCHTIYDAQRGVQASCSTMEHSVRICMSQYFINGGLKLRKLNPLLSVLSTYMKRANQIDVCNISNVERRATYCCGVNGPARMWMVG